MRGLTGTRAGSLMAAGSKGDRPSVATPRLQRTLPTNYTTACEAPEPMWRGAIPLRKAIQRKADGSQWFQMEKIYTHPEEKKVDQLHFDMVNKMYCVGNERLQASFPEGLPGRVHQMMPPGFPRGLLYRKESHLLNNLVEKFSHFSLPGKHEAVKVLCAGRPGVVLDGPTGVGKSALIAQAVDFARQRGVVTFFIPNARQWTHGEWSWPSVLLPGFFDVPDAQRDCLKYFSRAHAKTLREWPLSDATLKMGLPLEKGEAVPTTLFDVCVWGYNTPAPSSIDRCSVAIKLVLEELMNETTRPILFVIDGINLLNGFTHFRFPHPDFLRRMDNLNKTDVDLFAQEMPRIPSARLTLMRYLNRITLNPKPNNLFITASTRDFVPFDGGVATWPEPDHDRFSNSLDEYTSFDPISDTALHPINVTNFDDYEYRAYIRFLVNSSELAGLGWGPLWHHSPDFERKLYKIEWLSDKNPQKVIQHFHQELTWRTEYGRIRQKQHQSALLQQQKDLRESEQRANTSSLSALK